MIQMMHMSQGLYLWFGGCTSAFCKNDMIVDKVVCQEFAQCRPRHLMFDSWSPPSYRSRWFIIPNDIYIYIYTCVYQYLYQCL